jgi:catechol 2,3-dioxygenase-like lactoylglutathione lyase family enzyme
LTIVNTKSRDFFALSATPGGTGIPDGGCEKAAMLLSHIDLRVRDRAQGEGFYDALLSPLGAVMDRGATITTWQIGTDPAADWFGLTEDPAMTAGPARIAFAAPSRGTVDAIGTILAAIGARNIELPHEACGPTYYGCFFEDPDGNKLEVCHIG